MTVVSLGIMVFVDSSLSSSAMPSVYWSLKVPMYSYHVYTSPDSVRTKAHSTPHAIWIGVVIGDEQSRDEEMSLNGLPHVVKVQTVELTSKVIVR